MTAELVDECCAVKGCSRHVTGDRNKGAVADVIL